MSTQNTKTSKNIIATVWSYVIPVLIVFIALVISMNSLASANTQPTISHLTPIVVSGQAGITVSGSAGVNL